MARTRRRGVALLTVAVLSMGAATAVHRGAALPDVAEHRPLAGDPVRGLAILNATRDSLPRNVGNSLRCVSCHLDAGTRPFAMPWYGVAARYPKYRARSARVESLAFRVNDCFKRSLNGTPIDTAGAAMRDILAYITSVVEPGGATGVPAGAPSGAAPATPHGLGIDSLNPAIVGVAATGRKVFAAECARCHGANGGGDPKFSAPALWGARSYNVGAGMARVRILEAFVHRHMPFDRPGTLTPQQAADVAAWIDGHPRPDFREKGGDWPRGDAPADVPYATAGHRKP